MIKTKRAIDLTTDEYNRCTDLTYGDEGYMLEELDEAIYRERDHYNYRYTLAILAYERSKIVGWCLLQPIRGRSRYLAYFYVDEDHRRQGWGAQLLEEASKWGRWRPHVMPGYGNYGFFDKYPQLCEEKG